MKERSATSFGVVDPDPDPGGGGVVLSIRDVATRCGVGLCSTEEGSVLFRAPFVSVPDGPDADPAAFSDPRADPTASFATRAANIAFTDVVDADEDAAISAAASAALARARSRARAASSSSSAAAASATDSTGVRSAPGFVSGSVCSEFAARVRSLRLADAATAVSASMNVSFISFENGRLFAASFSVRRASVTSSGGGGGHASGASPENSVPETPEPIPGSAAFGGGAATSASACRVCSSSNIRPIASESTVSPGRCSALGGANVIFASTPLGVCGGAEIGPGMGPGICPGIGPGAETGDGPGAIHPGPGATPGPSPSAVPAHADSAWSRASASTSTRFGSRSAGGASIAASGSTIK